MPVRFAELTAGFKSHKYSSPCWSWRVYAR